MRLLSSLIAIPAFFFLSGTGIAADVYSCEVKAAYALSDDGTILRDGIIPSSRFMLDKNTGQAVGTLFNQFTEGWKVVQRGSGAHSLVSEGIYLGKPIYRIVVYGFNAKKQKPFAIEDHVNTGFVQIFSGLCE